MGTRRSIKTSFFMLSSSRHFAPFVPSSPNVVNMRSDTGHSHSKLDYAFNKKIDTDINNIDKLARMVKKLHGIANHIKANGMYSEQEMELEHQRMNKLNVNDEERILLEEVWEIRHLANKKIMNDLKKTLNEIKREMKK